jgi:hypothetical protein
VLEQKCKFWDHVSLAVEKRPSPHPFGLTGGVGLAEGQREELYGVERDIPPLRASIFAFFASDPHRLSSSGRTST